MFMSKIICGDVVLLAGRHVKYKAGILKQILLFMILQSCYVMIVCEADNDAMHNLSQP